MTDQGDRKIEWSLPVGNIQTPEGFNEQLIGNNEINYYFFIGPMCSA